MPFVFWNVAENLAHLSLCCIWYIRRLQALLNPPPQCKKRNYYNPPHTPLQEDIFHIPGQLFQFPLFALPLEVTT